MAATKKAKTVEAQAADPSPGPWQFKWFLHDEGTRTQMRQFNIGEPDARWISDRGHVSVLSADGDLIAQVVSHLDYKRGKGNELIDPVRDTNAEIIARAWDMRNALRTIIEKSGDPAIENIARRALGELE